MCLRVIDDLHMNNYMLLLVLIIPTIKTREKRYSDDFIFLRNLFDNLYSHITKIISYKNCA